MRTTSWPFFRMVCANCKAVLTEILQEHRSPVPPFALDSSRDSESWEREMPRGSFWKATKALPAWAEPGDIIVNRLDLVGLTQGHNRTGCCGTDGANGPNLLCACGAALVTEVDDCWSPAFAAFSSPRITLVEEETPSTADAAVLGLGEACVSRPELWSWLHSALQCPSWHGDDIESILLDRITSTSDPIDLYWLQSDASRQQGLPVDKIFLAVRKTIAQHGCNVRLFLK